MHCLYLVFICPNADSGSAEKYEQIKSEIEEIWDFSTDAERVVRGNKRHVGKRVIVTDVDGKVFRGIITNTESEFDTGSRKEEIELEMKGSYVGIPLDEIKSIKKYH